MLVSGVQQSEYICISIHIHTYPLIAIAKSLQSCPSLCDPRDGSPPGFPVPDSPGKNTGVGCHFLLNWMKVESESEVAQSCPTLSDPMGCSLPGSSIHGIFQARVLEWGAIAFSDIHLYIDPYITDICICIYQSYIYTYPLFFRFFFHIGHYRVLSTVPCALW